jgi:hypothetical protein
MQEQRDREAEEREKSAEAERKWWARHGIKTRCTWSPSTTCEMPSRCHTMAANALPHEMPPCGTTHCHHCRYCGCAVCDVCMGGTINVHRWISSEQGHPVSWIDKQGITHRGEVPAHARVGVSPKKVCRLCAEYAKQEVNTRVQLNFILDAIDAKAAEIQAAEATGTEPVKVVAIEEELLQLKKEYGLVSGEEWKSTAPQERQMSDLGTGAASSIMNEPGAFELASCAPSRSTLTRPNGSGSGSTSCTTATSAAAPEPRAQAEPEPEPEPTESTIDEARRVVADERNRDLNDMLPEPEPEPEPEPKSARRTTPAATPRATVISTHRKAMLQLAQKARGVAHWLNKPARQLDQGR